MKVDILLPLPVAGLFTYNIPDEIGEKAPIGRRVLVPFGKKKVHTGIIWSSPLQLPQEGESSEHTLKNIVCYLDDEPIVSTSQMRLWEWIASYYMCTLGEVMRAALPTAFRLESETRVRCVEDFEASTQFTDKQHLILDFLADGKVKTIDEIGKKLHISSLTAINRLLEIGAIQMDEHVNEKYRPKTQKWIRLASDYSNEELEVITDSLHRSHQQQKCFLAFLDASGYTHNGKAEAIPYEVFLGKTSFAPTIIKALQTKGILVIEERTISRLPTTEETLQAAHTLNAEQAQAVSTIHEHWQTKDVVLLHGVTASGKTEVYIHLIQQTIAQGKKVLYLVPEIALTTQLTERLRRIFGTRLGVYHSRFSDAERVEIYRDVLANDKYDILLGVRSSVLLPFPNLGLVIVDEEHESSYKQQEPAPRYHARNAAIMLAQRTHAKVLLGTATPAIETYFNAQQGKYGLATLTQRHQGVQMPKIRIVDSKLQYHRKEMTGHFSDILTQRITDEIGRNKQAIIFQNRRGYARYLECKQCGYVPKCVNCDVSMTMHERQGILSCHYCGYSIPIPPTCPVCKTSQLIDRGLGTEKIEDELQTIFPTARIARMDLDTTRNKHAHQDIITSFARHEVDILVGTQMVTKGLHFDDVSTVAVLNADNLMNKPDFRAYEQAFQMLEQVSGRAGRKDEQGEVIIQTFQPDNPVLHYVEKHDYEGFYQQQIAERKTFKYPPFHRLLSVHIRMRDVHELEEIAARLQAQLQAVFTHRCSRVIIPQISRVQNMYLRTILLKIEATASYSKAKELLQQQIDWLRTTPNGKAAHIYIDVDPL